MADELTESERKYGVTHARLMREQGIRDLARELYIARFTVPENNVTNSETFGMIAEGCWRAATVFWDYAND